MTEYRIEIISPGGLPSGITEDKYLSGKLSVLRNRNLANVFYRLGFVEIFGTGIIPSKNDGFILIMLDFTCLNQLLVLREQKWAHQQGLAEQVCLEPLPVRWIFSMHPGKQCLELLL